LSFVIDKDGAVLVVVLALSLRLFGSSAIGLHAHLEETRTHATTTLYMSEDVDKQPTLLFLLTSSS